MNNGFMKIRLSAVRRVPLARSELFSRAITMSRFLPFRPHGGSRGSGGPTGPARLWLLLFLTLLFPCAPTLAATPKIAAGDGFIVALREDGRLWSWGSGLGTGHSLPGDPNPWVPKIPLQIGTDKDWSDVAAGGDHVLALKQDGSLWAWGGNTAGQLGVGDTGTRYAPARVGLDNDWLKIKTSDYVSAALKADGSAWTWGAGFLGDGTPVLRNPNFPTPPSTSLIPKPVLGSGWSDLAFLHDGSVYGIKNGQLWGWGFGVNLSRPITEAPITGNRGFTFGYTGIYGNRLWFDENIIIIDGSDVTNLANVIVDSTNGPVLVDPTPGWRLPSGNGADFIIAPDGSLSACGQLAITNRTDYEHPRDKDPFVLGFFPQQLPLCFLQTYRTSDNHLEYAGTNYAQNVLFDVSYQTHAVTIGGSTVTLLDSLKDHVRGFDCQQPTPDPTGQYYYTLTEIAASYTNQVLYGAWQIGGARGTNVLEAGGLNGLVHSVLLPINELGNGWRDVVLYNDTETGNVLPEYNHYIGLKEDGSLWEWEFLSPTDANSPDPNATPFTVQGFPALRPHFTTPRPFVPEDGTGTHGWLQLGGGPCAWGGVDRAGVAHSLFCVAQGGGGGNVINPLPLKKPYAPQPGRVSGTIRDAKTGKAINGAAVTLNSLQTDSDASGGYSFDPVQQGDYVMDVAADGYYPKQAAFSVEPQAQILRDFNLELKNGKLKIVSVDLTIGRTVYHMDGPDLFFLDRVPVSAKFDVVVDWGSNSPGDVDFITPLETHTVSTAKNGELYEGSTTFDLGSSFGPNGRLKLVATTKNEPIVTAEFVCPLIVVTNPLPSVGFAWAGGSPIPIYTNRAALDVSFNGGIGPSIISDLTAEGDIPHFGQKPAWLGYDAKPSAKFYGDGHIEIKSPSSTVTNVFGDAAYPPRGESPNGGAGLSTVMTFGGGDWALAKPPVIPIQLHPRISSRWQLLPVPNIPLVYFDTELGLDVDGTVPLTSVNPVTLDSGTLDLDAWAKGTLGVDVGGLAGAKAWLTATGGVTLAFPPIIVSKAYVSASAGVEAYILVFRASASATWTWTSDGHTLRARNFVQRPPEPQWTLMPRDYSSPDRPVALQSRAKAYSGSSQPALVASGVFPASQSSIAERNGRTMLAWVGDDTNRSSLNRTRIQIQTKTQNGWSAPVTLTDDGTGDYHPQLELLPGGGAVLCYEDENQVFPESASMNDLLAGLEISVAFYDPTQARWSTPARLSANSYLDHSPRVAGTTNDLWVAWIGNRSNHPAPSGPDTNEIWTAHWDGAAWSRAQLAATIPHGVSSFDLAAKGGAGFIVLSADQNDTQSDHTDRELYSMSLKNGSWEAPVRLTTNSVPDETPRIVLEDNLQSTLIWQQGTQVLSVANFQFAQPRLIRTTGGGANGSGFKLALNAAGRAALVWQQAAQGQPDLLAQFYDPGSGTWGLPRQLTSDPETESFVSATLTDANELALAYNRQLIDLTAASATNLSQNVDLYQLSYQMKQDVTVVPGSGQTIPPNPLAGQSFTVEFTLTNRGDFAVQNIPLRFYLGDPNKGGQLLQTTNFPGVLAPGATAQAGFLWESPLTDSAQNVTVVVDPDAVIVGNQSSGSRDSVSMFAPNVILSSASWDLRGPSIVVRLVAANSGTIDSVPLPINLYRNNSDRTLLGTVQVPALSPGQTTELTASLPDGLSYPMSVAALVADGSRPALDGSDGKTAWLNINPLPSTSGQTDLAVTFRADASSLPLDQNFVCHVTVTNQSQSVASTVHVTLPSLPPEAVAWVHDITVSRGTWDLTGKLAVSLGDLPAGASAAIDFKVLLSNEGDLSLTAIANSFETDSNPSDNTAVLTLHAGPASQPPTVTLLSPSDGQTVFVGQPVTFSADASDPQGQLTMVQFLRNGVVVGTATTRPFQIILPAGFNFPGRFQVQAVAYDAAGLTAYSQVATVNAEPPPALSSVLITSPTNGASFAALANVKVDVQTTGDPNQFVSVTLFGGDRQLAYLFSQPFTYDWTNLSAGTYTVLAVGSAGGITLTSAPVTLTVTNGPTVGPTGWRVVAVGTPGANATGLNNIGQISGGFYDTTPPLAHHSAFIWSLEGGTSVLPVTNSLPNAYASALNDAGQVAGYFSGQFFGSTNVAFSWSASGGLVLLGSIGGNSVQPLAMNSSGQIVGVAEDNSGYSIRRPFTWTASTGIKILGGTSLFDPSGWALAVNGLGQLAGYRSAGLNLQAYLWATNGVPTALGFLPGDTSSQANGINDPGTVVGQSWGGTNGTRAFLWNAQTGLSLIPVPPAFSNGSKTSVNVKSINNAGVAVGNAAAPGNALPQAWAWAGGAMTNLNDLIPSNSGWVLSDAFAVNNSGQIAGSGYFLGQGQPFLLLPPQPLTNVTVVAIDPASLRFDTAGRFQFRINSTSVGTVVIQSSMDLTTWTSLKTNAVPSEGLLFQDPLSLGQPRRYYRATMTP